MVIPETIAIGMFKKRLLKTLSKKPYTTKNGKGEYHNRVYIEQMIKDQV